MNQSELDRLIKLSQKTGDALIIADPTGKQSVVVMPIERYEIMHGFTDHAEEMEHHPVYDESVPENFPEVYDETVPDLPVEDDLAPEPTMEPVKNASQSQREESGEEDEERFYLEPVE